MGGSLFDMFIFWYYLLIGMRTLIVSQDKLRYSWFSSSNKIVKFSTVVLSSLTGISISIISCASSLVVSLPPLKIVTPQSGTALLKIIFQLFSFGIVHREYVPGGSSLSIILILSALEKVVGSLAPVLQTFPYGINDPKIALFFF